MRNLGVGSRGSAAGGWRHLRRADGRWRSARPRRILRAAFEPGQRAVCARRGRRRAGGQGVRDGDAGAGHRRRWSPARPRSSNARRVTSVRRPALYSGMLVDAYQAADVKVAGVGYARGRGEAQRRRVDRPVGRGAGQGHQLAGGTIRSRAIGCACRWRPPTAPTRSPGSTRSRRDGCAGRPHPTTAAADAEVRRMHLRRGWPGPARSRSTCSLGVARGRDDGAAGADGPAARLAVVGVHRGRAR